MLSMHWWRIVYLLPAAVLQSCNESTGTITGPSVVEKRPVAPGLAAPAPLLPVTPLPTSPVIPVSFSWQNYRGFSAFATLAEEHSDEQIIESTKEALAHGWNTRRMCAETEFWDGSWPYLRARRDPARLAHVLEVISQVPGVQVLLVADCTLKGPVAVAEQKQWIIETARIASRYPNVALELVNEMDQCRGRGWGDQCLGKEDLRQLVPQVRRLVPNVTTDDHVCYGDRDLRFRFTNIGLEPADFHPCRENPWTGAPWDPMRDEGMFGRQVDMTLQDGQFLDELIAANGGFVLFSETISYNPYGDDCTGLRTCSKERVQQAIDRCLEDHKGQCVTSYHSIPGLAGDSYDWWPNVQ